MVSVTRYDIPSLILALVGLLVIIHGIQAIPHPGEPEYQHQIESVSATEIPNEANVLNYSELSSDGQRVVSEIIQSDNNQFVIHGRSNKPAEFTYSDHQEVNHGIHYISYQSNYYELTTIQGPPGTLDLVFLGGYGLVGGVAISIALYSIRYERLRLPLTLISGIVIWWGISETSIYKLSSNTQLVVGIVLSLVLIPTVVIWYFLGRIDYGKKD